MLKKIKNWIIKTLGGFNPNEYKRLLAIANNTTTIMVATTIPDYMIGPDFNILKYASTDIMNKIIDNGGLHLDIIPNPYGHYTNVKYTLKIVV